MLVGKEWVFLSASLCLRYSRSGRGKPVPAKLDTKFAAVKKLVVEFWDLEGLVCPSGKYWSAGSSFSFVRFGVQAGNVSFSLRAPALNWVGVFPYGIVYLEKIRVFKAGNLLFLGRAGAGGNSCLSSPQATSHWILQHGIMKQDSIPILLVFRKTGNG